MELQYLKVRHPIVCTGHKIMCDRCQRNRG